MQTMTIEEMQKHEWTISRSGGKDSTATVILCHEYGIPIKKIIYVRMMYNKQIPATLPIMTEFVDKAIRVFESWGYVVEVVESIQTAQDLSNKVFKRSKYKDRNGKHYGVSPFARGYCEFTGVKTKTINSISKSEYQMIGYAADETQRIHRLTETKQSIMVALDVKEKDTLEICNRYNLLSPLYDLGFTRDGCWFCPNAGKDQRLYLKENRPDLVEEIYKTIRMCEYDISALKKRNNWVKDYFQRIESGEQMHIFDFIK